MVRKRMVAFLEKALRFFGYDFRHDDYKKIVYAESACKTPFEEKVKSMYDAYYYLLSNAKSPLSSDILKKFFFLWNEIEPDETMLIRMTTKFFGLIDMPMIEKAIEYHLYVFSELCDWKDDERTIVSLMFFNYALVKSGVPSLRFRTSVLETYMQCRRAYFEGDKTSLYEFFLHQLSEAKFQDRSYYRALQPLTTKDVFDRILQEQRAVANTLWDRECGNYLLCFQKNCNILIPTSICLLYFRRVCLTRLNRDTKKILRIDTLTYSIGISTSRR